MSIEPNIEKLQYIFDNTKVGIAICNADDNHLEMVNSAFAHIHGYEPHELIGVAPSDVFAPECMLRLEAHESISSYPINDIAFETVHYKKDGSPVDVFVHITVIKDENGSVKHRIANIQDITEKKRESERLQESEKKRKKIETQFTSLASIIPDLIWKKDINGLYVDCNSAFENFFGTSKENILGKTDYDFFNKEAADCCKQTDIEVTSTGTINISQETFIYPEDKTTGIMEIRKVPVLNDKKIVGVLGIGRDITEQIRQQQQLVKMDYFLDNIKEGVLLVTENGKIEYGNQEICKMLGYTKEELLQLNVQDIDQESTIASWKTHWDELKIETLQIIESLHVTKEQVCFPVEIHANYFTFENKDYNLAIVRDITQKKQQENLLLRKEKELNALADNLPGFVYTYRLLADKREEFLYVSKGITDIYGISSQDALNNIGLVRALFHPDDIADFRAAIVKSAQTLDTFHIEFRVNHPLKGELWLESKATPETPAPDGSIVWHGVTLDITERKKHEKLLYQKEQEFRSLTENSPDTIARFNTECRRIYVNPAFERMFGRSAKEVLGKYPSESTPIVDNLAFEEQLRKVLKSGEEFTIETHFISASGEQRFGHIRMIPEFGKNEQVISVIVIGRDITKRRQQEELLRQKEQEFRTLIENSPDAIIRYDLECRRIFVNPKVEELFGIKKENLLGKTPTQLSPIPENFKFEEYINNVIKTKTGITAEMPVTIITGEKGHSHVRIVPEFDKKGDVCSVMLIGRDITERKMMEKMILAREYEFRTLAENAPNIIMRYNTKCERTYVNDAYVEQTGIPKEHAHHTKPDKQWGVYIHMLTMSAQEYQERILKVIQTGIPDQFVVAWYRLSDNVYVAHDLHVVAEKDVDENITGALAIGNNITKHQKLETDLHLAVSKLEQFINNIPEMAWIKDNKHRFIMANQVVVNVLGASCVEDVIGKTANDFFPYEYAKKCLENDIIVMQKGISLRTEDTFFSQDGKKIWIETIKSPFRDKMGEVIGTIGTARDIKDRIIVQKKIDHMAHHDALTGLPNRIFTKDKAELMIESTKQRGHKIALLFLDLDEFKTINDTMGHSVGDQMLKVVSARIQNVVAKDDIVSRQGGDEFVVVLSHIKTKDDVISITERILQKFEEPYQVGENLLYASASIGVALYPDNGNSFESLLQNADSAMYKAKELGKNTYSFFTEKMKHHMIGKFKLQNDLKNAVLNNEFVLYYQPQINRINNKITGAEALIRWKHPQLGMIPPDNFIPIAESSGLIIKIGEWVIKEACRQAACWKKQGMEIAVAVNISAVQFRRGNLREVIQEALSQSRLDPKFLELELTESLLMNDTENILRSVQEFKKLGIQLSIDDFGTGYSSLAYLKRFAVDKLKIDRSFVKDIVSDHEDATIVKTIIQMAKNLNLKTIAEGVEDYEVLTVLDSYGCDEIQGYYFAKPMEAIAFEKYHREFIGK